MSTAYYSARAGSAFLQDSGSSWLRLNVKQPDRWEPCASWEVAIAFRDCTDVLEIPAEDKQRIQDALVHAVHVMNASDLTLWLLDATLSEKTRTSAACELNPFLSNVEIVQDWTGIFWWQPLGKEADLENAIKIASRVNAQMVVFHLEDLRDRQVAIAHVRDQLEAVLVLDAVERSQVEKSRRRMRTERQHVAMVRAVCQIQEGKTSIRLPNFDSVADHTEDSLTSKWWEKCVRNLSFQDGSSGWTIESDIKNKVIRLVRRSDCDADVSRALFEFLMVKLERLARSRLPTALKRVQDVEELIVEVIAEFLVADEQDALPPIESLDDLLKLLYCRLQRRAANIHRYENAENSGGKEDHGDSTLGWGESDSAHASFERVPDDYPSPHSRLLRADDLQEIQAEIENALGDKSLILVYSLWATGLTKEEISRASQLSPSIVDCKLELILRRLQEACFHAPLPKRL